MKRRRSYIALFLLCASVVWAQSRPPKAINISAESHHSLVFSNGAVQIFKLQLQPNEVTAFHHHDRPYVYLSLHTAEIANEVPGHPPVITDLGPLQLRSSHGGFSVAERNISAAPVEIWVVEPVRSSGPGFVQPLGAFEYHDAAIAELSDGPSMRVYAMTIAAGGRVASHAETYGRVFLAASNLQLRETVAGQSPAQVEMKTGEARWLAASSSYSVENLGSSPADFIVFEFN
jgi:hypothetical protein